MNCRICNSAPDSRGYCPNCGFDEGLAYEYYPTLQQIVESASISGLCKKWTESSLEQEANRLSLSVPPTPCP